MTKLSVNLNAVAYLRNRRDVGWPDLLKIAEIIMNAGAHGLTVHPRPDERHIRRRDVFQISSWIQEKHPDAEFNIEGFPSEDFLALVSEVRPAQVTLVPDDPEQETSDHGWNLAEQGEFLKPVISSIKEWDSRVSIFVDPDPSIAQLASSTGADRIEIYTGPYGGAADPQQKEAELALIQETARAASGLGINAGHDLTAMNLPALMSQVPELAEVSIGHGITSDALIHGFDTATRNYLAAIGGH